MVKRGKKGGRYTGTTVAVKRCTRCYKTKELTDFYADRSRGDGLSSKCKECECECRKRRRQKLQSRTPGKMPHIKSKRCSKCGESKPVTDFYSSTSNSDGYTCHCKLCIQKQKQAYHKRLAARHRREIPRIETKRCPRCGEVKPVSKFYKAVGKVAGYATHCKDCAAVSAREHKKKVADRDFADIQVTGNKRCWMCGRNLPASEFNYCRSSIDGLASHCRECGQEYKRQHYDENYAELYNRQVEYRQRYPERKRAFAAVYQATSKGQLIRPDTCSKCGNTGYIVAHHDDYETPMDVVWLCLRCDRQLHADLRRKERKVTNVTKVTKA